MVDRLYFIKPKSFKMRFNLFLAFLLGFIVNSYAQNETLVIYIRDCMSGQLLAYEEVNINNKQLFTDHNGRIYLKYEAKELNLKYSKIGRSVDTTILLNKGINEICINKSYSIDTVFIQEYVRPYTKEMNAVVFGQELIKSSNYLLGEKDIIKALQFLPGVVQGQEGSVQYFVRGGTSGENQILLDDVPISMTGHAFGFISNIDANIVQKAKFYKGGFPADLGNRLSSYLDIRTIDPISLNKNTTDITVGTLTTTLLHSRKFGKKVGFVSSFRTSPLPLFKEGYDGLLNFINRSDKDTPAFRLNYYFGDTYQKLSYAPNKKVQLSFSYFNAQDQILNIEKYARDTSFETGRRNYYKGTNNWKNEFLAFNGNFSPNLKTNIRFYANASNQYFELNDYQLGAFFASKITEVYFNKIQTKRAGIKVNHFITNNLSINAGAEAENNQFENYFKYVSATRFEEDSYKGINTFGSLYTMLSGTLVDNKLDVQLGIRGVIDRYRNLEPRINIEYKPNATLRVNTAVSRVSQRSHLITRETVGVPYQIWQPSSSQNLPSVSDQITAGVQYEGKSTILSIDAYTKKSKNLVLPSLGQDIFIVNPERTLINNGENWSRGIELQAYYKNQKLGALTLNYTLSKSLIKFPQLQNNRYFRSYADRPHVINVQYNYQNNKKWEYKANWVYTSGNVITIPDIIIPALGSENFDRPWIGSFQTSGVFVNENSIINLYTPQISRKLQYDANNINNARVRSHHRLDISATKHYTKGKFERTLSFGFYNIYLRKNPFISHMVTTPLYSLGSVNIAVKSVSIFNFLPFVSYSVKI